MNTITLAGQLRIQAHANRLANRRLHAAMAALSDAEFAAPRTGFFPSLSATLNHLLAVDGYYIACLQGHGDAAVRLYDDFVPAGSVAELALRQAESDAALIAFCKALDDEAGCGAPVAMPRSDHVQHDRVAHVLAHLFMHQTHHRGQAHAMLSSTTVAPPQLDEFLMPSEPHLRTADMAALDWDEAEVYG
jgi:uncharacterized damage-inducible protein DinB